MKVFFDIITNHTADVITYEEGGSTLRRSGHLALRGRHRGGVRRPRRRGRADLPGDDGRPVPVHADLTGRREGRSRSRPGSTIQRCTTTVATRRSPARASTRRLRRASTNRSPKGPRSTTAGDIYTPGWTRGRRLPDRHGQAREPRVLATVRARGAGYAARPATTTSSCSAKCSTGDPAFLSTYTTAGRTPAVLDFGFQDGASASRHRQPAGLRVLYAGDDVPHPDDERDRLPTFLGNHDMGRIG